LVHFFRFGILYQEKSGNPDSHLMVRVVRIEGEQGRELLLDPCRQMQPHCQRKVLPVDDVFDLMTIFKIFSPKNWG
jgi:hypothetical protein